MSAIESPSGWLELSKMRLEGEHRGGRNVVFIKILLKSRLCNTLTVCCFITEPCCSVYIFTGVIEYPGDVYAHARVSR